MRVKTGGRKKGTPNKTTVLVKESMKAIVEGNVEKAQKMLDAVVDPKDWTLLYLKYVEFCIPKCAAQVEIEEQKTDIHSELQEMAKRERERRQTVKYNED